MSNYYRSSITRKPVSSTSASRLLANPYYKLFIGGIQAIAVLVIAYTAYVLACFL